MAMKLLREGAKGGLGKFILVGFMALAVGGLVLMDMGGFFRGGVTSTDVAKVGKQTINVNAFNNQVRRTLNRLGISPQEAYKLGYVQQLLGSEIRTSLLLQAAHESGVLVSDKQVAGHIQKLIAPISQPGEKPADVLNRLLMTQGISEGEFVASIKREMAQSLLTEALKNGAVAVSDPMALDLYKGQNETRSIEYIVFSHTDVGEIKDPTEEELRGLYDMTRENFAKPETRSLKIVNIDMSALKDSIEIAEEHLQQQYQDNIDLYTLNRSWTLDQALLSSEKEATSVVQAVKNGASIEQAVIDTTSNATAYLGEKRFEESEFLDEVKEPVMAAQEDGAVLPPLETPLGWYVIKVKTISPKSVKPYEDVRDEIREELMTNTLIDQMYEQANVVDDMFAGGATLEEVQEQADVTVIDLPPVNSFGQTADSTDALKEYEKGREAILQAGFELLEGETSPVQEMENGKFMAVHVETITPKSYTPFEQAKTSLKKRWIADQRLVRNRTRVNGLLAGGKDDKKSLKDIAKVSGKAIKRATNLKVSNTPEKPLLPRSLFNIFEAPVGQPFAVDVDGGLAIVSISDVNWPEDISQDDLSAFKASLVQKQQEEAIIAYLMEKQKQYGVKVNTNLLDRLYGADSSY